MSRPNVVFILADDLGAGDLSMFNGGLSRTPVLDQLAGEGTVLTQHYSSSPVCAPARASFLTGRYPHRTGALDTLEGRGLDRIHLDEVTLADAFRAVGYATGLVGKWHNGALDERFHPNRRGFAEFAGFSGGWSDYWSWRLDRNGTIRAGDGRYLTEVLTDEAVAFIGRHRSEPFLLHLAYSAPHYPLQVPDAELEPFLRPGELTAAVSRLYAMVAVMDRGIGRVLEALETAGVAEDTIVVFSSDNGPQFGGEGDNCMDRFNCHFRGHKLLVYEGGIRLPAILRWPAGLPAAATIDGLVHLTDWFPTLLATAGIDTPGSALLDGVDVLPLLRGEPDQVSPTRFWQWNRYTPIAECNAAMRDGQWKLVRPALPEAMEVLPADLSMDIELKYRPDVHPRIRDEPMPEVDPGPVPPAQLFDLSVDPGEEFDLAASHPERVRQMEAELGTWFEEVMHDYAILCMVNRWTRG